MAYKFGERTVKNVLTVHPILQEVAARAIESSPVDFGVIKSGGRRTVEEQHELYLMGRSRCDGYEKISYHQSGMAIDFVPYINGKYTWEDLPAFIEIAATIFKVWEDLPSKYQYYLHWGGYWGAKDLDKNGILEIGDELGWDLPHFELRTYPQTKGVYPLEQR